MAWNRVAGVFGLLALSAGSLIGCRDEPVPPTPDKPTGSQAADDQVRRSPLKAQRVSAQATKIYRLESCYFGTVGMRYAREAYDASLGGAQPSPAKIPEFGTYTRLQPPAVAGDAGSPQGTARPNQPPVPPDLPSPGEKPKAGEKKLPAEKELGDKRALMRGQRLPFARYARACTIAKSLKDPPSPELDAELGRYEAFVTKLNQAMLEAQRYYHKEKYKEDSFERGLELHKELTDAFKQLDERIDAFGSAIEAWRKTLEPMPDPLDETGKLAQAAVDQARALTVLLMGKKVDAEAVSTGVKEFIDARAALEKQGQQISDSPFPRMLRPQLEKFRESITVAQEELKGDGVTQQTLFFLSTSYAQVHETQYRAITRLLRGTQRGKLGHPYRGVEDEPPVRVLKPSVKPSGSGRPDEEPRGPNQPRLK